MLKFMFLLFFVPKCYSSKILGLMFVPSYSHHLTFQPLWKELSLRGHEVTVVTAFPMNDETLTNLTEINAKATIEAFEKRNILDVAANSTLFEALGSFTETLDNLMTSYLTIPALQALYHSKDAHFDVVLFEVMSDANLIFARKFNCPAIGIASMDFGSHYHSYLGNPTHPLINPDINLDIEDLEDMNFWQRLLSTYYMIVARVSMDYFYIPMVTDIVRKVLDPDIPNLGELQKHVKMLFLVSHPILQYMRPVNPNTITIGTGLHLKPPKELSEDIQDFLDGAISGAVYFSLGSNVKSNVFNDDKKTEILKAFEELPFKFLIKGNWPNLVIPKNVKLLSWIPQQDVLRHKNVKLFITQGGLQSLQETLTYAVPIVGIPFFGDQFVNIHRAVKNGYGVKLDKTNITRENVKKAIFKVLQNPKYRETAENLGKLLHDQPQTDLEKAVWWTEFVIRNKEAKFLHNFAGKLPWYQYLLLDVLAFTIIVLFIILSVFLSFIFVMFKILIKLKNCASLVTKRKMD